MAKKKWPKLPGFTIPLFRCANVYLCRTAEEWDSACDYLGCEGGSHEMLSGCTQTFQNKEAGENTYLLGVFNNDLATLVHECGHIAFYVCRDVNVPTDASLSSETYCYMLDRLFSEFLPYIRPEQTKE